MGGVERGGAAGEREPAEHEVLDTDLTRWDGFHRSSGRSPLCSSSPGGCRMEMQTTPVAYTLGCQIGSKNFIVGGLCVGVCVGVGVGMGVCVRVSPTMSSNVKPFRSYSSTHLIHENKFKNQIAHSLEGVVLWKLEMGLRPGVQVAAYKNSAPAGCTNDTAAVV